MPIAPELRSRKPIRLAGLALLLASSLPANAQPDDVAFAEALVRADYVEGLPYAEARKLSSAGVTRLIEMLRDPTEAPHHENIVMALGISGSGRAYRALAALQAHAPAGEVDAAQYRARRAIPLALGHLARSDPRALRFLLERADRREAPRWHYRHLRDQRLAEVLRRAAITGVGLSGRPEAAAALRALAAGARHDPDETSELRVHVEEAERLCERLMREGADRVFGREALR